MLKETLDGFKKESNAFETKIANLNYLIHEQEALIDTKDFVILFITSLCSFFGLIFFLSNYDVQKSFLEYTFLIYVLSILSSLVCLMERENKITIGLFLFLLGILPLLTSLGIFFLVKKENVKKIIKGERADINKIEEAKKQKKETIEKQEELDKTIKKFILLHKDDLAFLDIIDDYPSFRKILLKELKKNENKKDLLTIHKENLTFLYND